MQELKCPNINAYLDLLNKSAELRKECEMRMTVSISRFFRDRKLWAGLEEDILPTMIETHPKKIQVWSAGCARGEEVYSFRIVWQRLKQAYEHLPGLHRHRQTSRLYRKGQGRGVFQKQFEGSSPGNASILF